MNRRLATALLKVWQARVNRRKAKLKRATPGTRRYRMRAAALKAARKRRDTYQQWLATHPRISPARMQRERVIAWCSWALRHEPQIHYEQHRPMRLDDAVAMRLPLRLDCSESTTAAYKYAGAPDPNGRDYDGIGNTQTMRSHLRHIGIDEAQIGDPIIYGTSELSTQHVCIVWTPGPDPLVFSHGQEAGPMLMRHSVEVRAHHGVCTAHDGGFK